MNTASQSNREMPSGCTLPNGIVTLLQEQMGEWPCDKCEQARAVCGGFAPTDPETVEKLEREALRAVPQPQPQTVAEVAQPESADNALKASAMLMKCSLSCWRARKKYTPAPGRWRT